MSAAGHVESVALGEPGAVHVAAEGWTVPAVATGESRPRPDLWARPVWHCSRCGRDLPLGTPWWGPLTCEACGGD